MSLPDEFSTYVVDWLDGRYDCVDRIVLNGYFLMGQTSGGLLTWWNQLHPGAPLDSKRLEQMAGDCYSCYQLEYSRNLLFQNGRCMDQIYQGLIERTRGLLDVRTQLERMVVDFLAAVQAAHLSYLDSGALDKLPTPSVRGTQRLAGVDLQKPRMQAVAQAVVALAPQPSGFTAAQLAQRLQEQQGPKLADYTGRRAAYDLRKLRGKDVVERVGRTRRYRLKPAGLRLMAGLLILREKVIKPVLAGVAHPRRGRPPKTLAPLDQHYQNLRKEMLATLRTLKIAA